MCNRVSYSFSVFQARPIHIVSGISCTHSGTASTLGWHSLMARADYSKQGDVSELQKALEQAEIQELLQGCTKRMRKAQRLRRWLHCRSLSRAGDYGLPYDRPSFAVSSDSFEKGTAERL